MKSTKKIVSIILSAMMLVSCLSLTANASTGKLCSDYYVTNPKGNVGTQKTITIDGNASDWSEDMLIAQGAAWDVANHYKGGHENCVLDTYALFATWDNSNLYVGWQMVNTTDTWARSGDGPLSDGGRVLDVPLILALSVDPSSTSMSALNTDGGPIWSKLNTLKFKQHVDHMLFMSGKVGNGDPSMFTAVDAQGNTNYKEGCKLFANSGIEYKMAEGNVCSKIMGLNYSEDTNDVKGVMSNIGLADFASEKTFVKVVFNVIGTGTTDVNLDVQHLSVGYYESENNLNSAYIVDFSNLNDITVIPGFTDAHYTAKTVFDPNDSILYGDLNGDVNHDGRVDIQDATLIQKMFAEIA